MLKILQPGIQPLGQFDGLDSELTTFKGGEVCTFTSVATKSTGGTDKAAADVIDDGYSGTTSKTRPAVTLTLASGVRPLFLADDGNSGYGTLMGTVVGGTAGSISSGGAVLGPHTATGSGKITLWDKPGLYAVSLDAADTTGGSGLTADNAALNAGDPLYATTAGLLTPNSGAAFEALVVGRFVEFTTNSGALVNTPDYLVDSLPVNKFTEAVFHFHVEW